ncbi:hypothetical protein Q8F79_26465, partial [Klebsiella pneumoniae]|nr:hypothetical protein [Klebsiella pneumoniae]
MCIRDSAKDHHGEFRITANHNLVVARVPEDQQARMEDVAPDRGLMNAGTPPREYPMACVSFLTLPQAAARLFYPSDAA